MPPFSNAIATTMYETRIETRGLGGNLTGPNFSPSQGNTLQVLALLFSTISVASAMLAFYWFVKMQRSFRHDLVMFLIQSDMFKALWLMIYPIVTFVKGPVPSASKFCQVNGFFLSLGIEASDFAVLQIAIHTALYIFKPKVSRGEGGLYPYRKLAYIAWVVFPVLMASLAFINDQSAYTDEGTYCYLPVRPFWFRLALSWIPRYIIFIVILCIYASIYYYVRYKFQGFKNASRAQGAGNSDSLNSEVPRHPPKQYSLPPTPTLACHGLIPEPQATATNDEGPKFYISTLEAYRERSAPANPGAHRFMWANIMATSKPSRLPTIPVEPVASEADADSSVGPLTPQPLPNLASAAPASPISHHPSLTTPPRSRLTSWRDHFVRRFSPLNSDPNTAEPSVVDIYDILRHPDGSDSTPISQLELELVNSRGQNLASLEMIRTRDKIRRQLRFLFIYPLVYIGMWIIPFVSHVLQYDDTLAVAPPFALTCVTTVFISSQAAVDCWLFSTRETPWRHIPGSDGTFWGSLKFWSGWKGASQRRVVHGPGKTRGEIIREARVAYLRRDQEMAQQRTGAVSGVHIESGVRRTDREWWESGNDGAMSAVSEESNPIEDIVILEHSGADDATLTNDRPRSSKDTEEEL
ncbi:G protein-coupled receptor GPR1 [Lachnellula suecica]|uniref:G protein-coupled receptor GPR1 n=1 Tax=Lachnellula suecica TaxID=602035 RepID=A0A8T9CHU0_9HELO|nr:G protein-coupled receptor GPR1 [Lachnellula suecica]